MHRIKFILKNVFISPEFFFLLLVILFYLVSKEPFIFITNKLIENELLAYTPITPIALLSFSIANMRNILSPSVSNKSLYYKWEGFQEVKDITYIGIFYLLIGLIMSVLPLFIGIDSFKGFSGLLLLISYSISFIASATMLFASQKVEEILEVNS